MDVRLLLIETFGGFAAGLVELIKELAEQRHNKLYSGEYDATTWSARTWTSFNVQKLSVAVHRSVALEIAHALGLATAADPRAADAA